MKNLHDIPKEVEPIEARTYSQTINWQDMNEVIRGLNNLTFNINATAVAFNNIRYITRQENELLNFRPMRNWAVLDV